MKSFSTKCLESYITYLYGDYTSKEQIKEILMYAQGYSAEEINKIECFYYIHAFKELKNFLFFIGRCSGGVLSNALISVQYNPLIENIIGYQDASRIEMSENGFSEYINEKPFFIAADRGNYLPHKNIVIKHSACVDCERSIFVLTAEKNQ